MTETVRSTDMTYTCGREHIFAIAVLVVTTVASFWKIFLINDVIWDDNCWLQSAYLTDSVRAFNDTGWALMRRDTVGAFYYYLFLLHRHTEYFFVVWHILAFASQLLAALLLYLLVSRLFNGRRRTALFIAVSFLIVHLDQSLPYASGLNYRVGLVLALGSLYVTLLGLQPSPRWRLLLLSSFIAALGSYIFIEAAIAIEPARIAMIVYILHKNRNLPIKTAILHSAPYASLFIMAAVPLILYKLFAKPYGIYTSSYVKDPLFFLNFNRNFEEIRNLLFSDWLTFWKLGKYATSSATVTAVIFIAFFFYILTRIPSHISNNATSAPSKDSKSEAKALVWLGLLLLIPPILLFQFSGLDLYLRGTQNNTHAIFLQPGYAVLIGAGVSWLYERILDHKAFKRYFLYMACAASLGVYHNNVGIDLYQDSWSRQSQFWRVFMQRFPTLPPKADFFIDVRDSAYFSDLRIYFDLESGLNLLYARDTDSNSFRRYRVFTMEEYLNTARQRRLSRLDSSPIDRNSHWGHETLDPKKFIVALYINGKLYVGDEIRRQFKGVPYENWLDNPLPLGDAAQVYPLRHRLRLM